MPGAEREVTVVEDKLQLVVVVVVVSTAVMLLLLLGEAVTV